MTFLKDFKFSDTIQQLEKKRGGYYYIRIDRNWVDQLSRKNKTRLICKIDGKVEYQCGLNHLGDGNFFIILAGKYLKTLGKTIGDHIEMQILEDPNPLGVEIPDVILILMEEDDVIKEKFNNLTDGKKRALIFSIIKIKNIDIQVKKILKYLELD